MPADYDVLSSESTTVVLSATAAQEMTRFGIITKPNGGTAMINVPAKGVTAQQASVSLQRYALLIEAAFDLQGVVGARAEQDVDGSGLLADYVVFTVQYVPADGDPPGDYTREVRVLTRNLSSDLAFGQYVSGPINAAYQFLASVVEG